MEHGTDALGSAAATIGAVTIASKDKPKARVELRRGAVLGRYVVLGPLGAGGMGSVYAAHDPELDRKVAIKLLHDAASERSGEASLGRLRLVREAQALARLTHPNVVAVHDVGQADGRVFVAMELVDGVTVRAWLEEQVRPWREVLRVFLEAAAGLAAAHAAGIIHRDFKPDNVMLGDDGRVRVMDFGLARAPSEDVEETVRPANVAELETSTNALSMPMTAVGAFIGTPMYMAPEQFTGELTDARTDQFSFCVALHEGLYGARPFRGTTIAELAFQVGEGAVQLPADDRGVPAWLRRAVLRGLSSDPAARWPSMSALIEALDRDPGRRRRLLTTAAVALVGVASVGFGAWSLTERRAAVCAAMERHLEGVWDDERRASVRAALATGGDYGEENAARVTAGLDAYADAWVAARGEACVATRVRGEQSVELMDARVACLDGRLGSLRALVDVLEGGAAVDRAIAAVGKLPAIDRCGDADFARAKTPVPEDKSRAEAVERLRERLSRVQALVLAGTYDAALDEARALLERAEALGFEPFTTEVRLEHARALSLTGAHDEALAAFEVTYFAAERHGMDAVALEAAVDLVAEVGHHAARFEEGLSWGRFARAKAERQGERRLLGYMLTNEAALLDSKGESEQALARDREALDIFKSLRPPAPEDISLALNHEGNILKGLDRLEEAHAVLTQALELRTEVFGAHHPMTALTLNNLGIVELRRGHTEAALRTFERALELRVRALGADHPHVASTLINLGTAYPKVCQIERARDVDERALEILTAVHGEDHPRTAGVLNNLAGVHLDLGELDKALQSFERACLIWRETLPPEHQYIGMCHYNLARTYLALDRAEEALTEAQAARDVWQLALGPEATLITTALVPMARALVKLARVDEAVGVAEEALRIAELHEDNASRTANARLALAEALWERGDQERARTAARAAQRYAHAELTECDPLRVEVDAWIKAREGAAPAG